MAKLKKGGLNPAKDVSPGRPLWFGQRRFLRPAAAAASMFIIGAALLLLSRYGLLPGAHKGELNLTGYLDLVGAVAAAEPALREFPAAPGFTEIRWPEASSVASQSDKKHVQPGAEFKLPDLDGRQISSADLKGSVVVLDFWATWCGPCLAEMPTFNSLHGKYAGRGVKVIGIAVQSGWAEDIKPYINRYKIAYLILVGDDEVVEKYGVIGFPTTYILDKDLKIHRKFTGELPRKEELEREIESLLADR